MNFDYIGEQRVSRRRKPSPLMNAKYSPSVFDTDFPQKVWPRNTYSGNYSDTRSRESAQCNREDPLAKKTYKPAAKTPVRRSAGFSISTSLLKKMAIMGGILVIAVIGPNWESISGWFKQHDVSVESLEDRGAFSIMESRADLPVIWEPAVVSSLPHNQSENTDILLENIPLNLTESFKSFEHKVKKGETISGIAAKYSISQGSLIAINGLKEAWNLRVGKVLKIPNMDGIPYTVQKNDSLLKIAEKNKIPLYAILDANNIVSDTIQPGDTLFLPGARMDAGEFKRAVSRSVTRTVAEPREKPMIYPLIGGITSGYGWRLDPLNPVPGNNVYHKALDIIGKIGDPVKAAMKGTVMIVDDKPDLGIFIVVNHGTYQTLYAHLSETLAEKGDEVKQGQIIAKVGNTGRSTGPHLHFAVFHKGNLINPKDLLK